MGMSLEDFDLCTPPEFKKIFEKWREGEEQQMRRSWEQTRQLALCMLQPWSKNKLEAEDVWCSLGRGLQRRSTANRRR